MKNEPVVGWIEEEATAVFSVPYKNQVFTGVATCHPEDMDMCSEKTGYYIAEMRAAIKTFRYRRDELKQQLAALKQLYYSMNQSKKFNPKSYENIMLQRQIHLIENDLQDIKLRICRCQENLREYLKLKQKFYEKIRTNRRQAENKQEN